jgi:CubicO group peptidase (beta-lactamase class C family)
MTRRTLLAFTALALCTPLQSADLAQEVGRIANFYHEQYQFNGTVLVSKSGEVVFRGAYGMANREWGVPHTVDTRFRLGSITKQFTAVLILQLVSERKIELEAPLSRYVSEYPAKVADRVTVHHLLTHTSGIKSYTSLPSFFQDTSRDPYKAVDFLKIFADEPLDFEPGERFRYNNSGYFLLGVIIEKAAGMTYEEALAERIFEPLGMMHSGYDHAEVVIEKRAEGYDARLGRYRNAPYLDMSLPYAAGSLYSTVDDLYLWDRALAANKVLSPEMSEKMFHSYEKVAQSPDAPSYGYGWFVNEIDRPGADGQKIRIIDHGGGINGFNTLIQRIPEDGHLIVLLNNSPGASLSQMAENIRPILYGEATGDLKKSSAVDVYDVYKNDGATAAAARWKEIRDSDEYFNAPPEAMRLIRGVAEESPKDARKLLEESDLPEEPQPAGMWMILGDAFAEKSLRNEAAEAYGKALQQAPGLADTIAEKLKDLPERTP